MLATRILATTIFAWALVVAGAESRDDAFYVSENPHYTICDSALDSLRFTAEKTLRPDEHGHLVSISSFVDSDAQVMNCGWWGLRIVHDGHIHAPARVADQGS